MVNRLRPEIMYASVREYLLELEESGVEGVPEEHGPEARGQEPEPPTAEPRTLEELRHRSVTVNVVLLLNPAPIWSLEQVMKKPGLCLLAKRPALMRTVRVSRL